MLPFIGHTGICEENGIIHDFSGPYSITVDDFAFGNPTKYVQLSPHDAKGDWMEALEAGDSRYRQRMHNICCDNCHSHVANVLNEMKYRGSDNWNMFSVWWLCCSKSKYVGFMGFFKTYIGFLILAFVVLLLVFVF
jgi:hypothetical protein